MVIYHFVKTLHITSLSAEYLIRFSVFILFPVFGVVQNIFIDFPVFIRIANNVIVKPRLPGKISEHLTTML